MGEEEFNRLEAEGKPAPAQQPGEQPPPDQQPIQEPSPAEHPEEDNTVPTYQPGDFVACVQTIAPGMWGMF